MKLLVTTGKKLTFNFCTYIFEYWPLPTLHPPRVHSCDECFQAFSVFHCFPLPHIIVNTEGKMGGGLGTRLGRAFIIDSVNELSKKFLDHQPTLRYGIATCYSTFLLCEAGWGPRIHPTL